MVFSMSTHEQKFPKVFLCSDHLTFQICLDSKSWLPLESSKLEMCIIINEPRGFQTIRAGRDCVISHLYFK